MINRRSLLVGLGSLALGQALAGCRRFEDAALKIQILADSIPAQLLAEFQRQAKRANVAVSPKLQLADLLALLQAWDNQQNGSASSVLPGWIPFIGTKPPPPTADLVTLGDYWLTTAIQEKLIQSLDASKLTQWQSVPPQWQSLVRRNDQGQPDPQGQIWAAPYRWGTTVIAYRVEEFETLGWAPTDWSDLWKPELKGQISLLDSPRETIGLTLKKLGQSVNTTNLTDIGSLKGELVALQQQGKFYSSDAYLQPLLLGDTWAAVGWSTDVLPLLKRDRRIAAVVPTSGTILTADLWVRPTGAPQRADNADNSSLVSQWIDFWWTPDIATQLALLGLSASPVLVGRDRTQLPKALQTNPLLLPSNQILQRSEFLLPLSETTAEQYRRLWTDLRQMG
jgi:putative spermidine/putrescine transport system substrate-binding protein